MVPTRARVAIRVIFPLVWCVQMDSSKAVDGGKPAGVGRKLMRYKAFDDPMQDPEAA